MNLGDEQFDRVSYILNIHRDLRMVLINPANVSGFMHLNNSNDYFAGRTPLDAIASGQFDDVCEVSRRINALKVESE